MPDASVAGAERAPAPAPPVNALPTRLSQAGLALIASAAAAALALEHGMAVAWALVVVAALSITWRIHRASPRVIAVASSAVRVLTAAVVLTAVFVTLYPVLDDPHVARLGAILGTALLLPTALALLATPILPPAMGAAPLSVALLALASFHVRAPLHVWHALAAAGAILYLAAGVRRVGVTVHRRRLAGLAVLFGIAVAVAASVSLFLPWAQPKVEDMTASILEPAQGRPGFSPTSRLGDIQSLALSRVVVMRVWGDPPRKLRGRVLTQFDGRTWQAPSPRWRDVPPLDAARLPGDLAAWLARVGGESFGDAAAATRDGNGRMVIAPVGVGASEALFAPGPAWVVRARLDGLRRDASGVFDAPYEVPPVYAVVHGPAGGAISDEGGDDPALLAVPKDIDPRVGELAARLDGGARSADERVARTLDHLWSGYQYSLSVGQFTSSQPVAEFLFEKKKGWCEYFASAAVVLLRLQGVPARYVTGFSMDGARRVAGQYVVRESDAHAWIEAYVPGRGWIEADPTPAGDYAAAHTDLGGGVLERVLDAIRAAWADLALAVRMGDVRWLLVALRDLLARPLVAVPLVLAAAATLWRRRRARALPPMPVLDVDPELAALVARAESLWAACGHARPRHRAPLEHVEAAGRHLPVPTREATRAVVDCLYRARYAGVAVPASEIRHLRERLDSLRA